MESIRTKVDYASSRLQHNNDVVPIVSGNLVQPSDATAEAAVLVGTEQMEDDQDDIVVVVTTANAFEMDGSSSSPVLREGEQGFDATTPARERLASRNQTTLSDGNDESLEYQHSHGGSDGEEQPPEPQGRLRGSEQGSRDTPALTVHLDEDDVSTFAKKDVRCCFCSGDGRRPLMGCMGRRGFFWIAVVCTTVLSVLVVLLSVTVVMLTQRAGKQDDDTQPAATPTAVPTSLPSPIQVKWSIPLGDVASVSVTSTMAMFTRYVQNGLVFESINLESQQNLPLYVFEFSYENSDIYFLEIVNTATSGNGKRGVAAWAFPNSTTMVRSVSLLGLVDTEEQKHGAEQVDGTILHVAMDYTGDFVAYLVWKDDDSIEKGRDDIGIHNDDAGLGNDHLELNVFWVNSSVTTDDESLPYELIQVMQINASTVESLSIDSELRWSNNDDKARLWVSLPENTILEIAIESANATLNWYDGSDKNGTNNGDAHEGFLSSVAPYSVTSGGNTATMALLDDELIAHIYRDQKLLQWVPIEVSDGDGLIEVSTGGGRPIASTGIALSGDGLVLAVILEYESTDDGLEDGPLMTETSVIVFRYDENDKLFEQAIRTSVVLSATANKNDDDDEDENHPLFLHSLHLNQAGDLLTIVTTFELSVFSLQLS